MHRTQIYLGDEQYRVLRARARALGTSLAAIIRDILDRHLVASRPKAAKDPLDDAIGIGRGHGEAVAENVDDYLYGRRR